MPAVNPTAASYILALFTAVLQCIFGTLTGCVPGDSPHLYIFGKLAGGLALVTCIWIGILMNYNPRSPSTKPLCRPYAHLTSFAVFGVSWLAIFIMLASQTPWECRGHNLWCSYARFSTALACFTSIFSISATYFIYRSAKSSGIGLLANGDQISGKAPAPDI